MTGFVPTLALGLACMCRVLERALEAVGDNPRAGALWRRGVAFEEAQVCMLFTLCRTPFGLSPGIILVGWWDFCETEIMESWRGEGKFCCGSVRMLRALFVTPV